MMEGKFLPDQKIIGEIFGPIIGLPCWGTKRIIGNIISLEFGIVAKPAMPSPVSLRRAAANPAANIPIKILPPGGEWNFSLLSNEWIIKVNGGAVSSAVSTDAEIEVVLEQINGQTLTRADWAADNQLILSFREGACIRTGMPANSDPDCMVWWLLHTGVVNVSFDGDGMLDISYPK
jgi:hypothetical protein